ncbi:MAG: AmmeMemoRadiSam system radical SAM enzyme [Candidatus Methylarchaceae archaeon HK02M1]|nr:AmmeMemoRadiSam system radical SAM enzyme [Candidatus Methylarchaceae archaeon HK02M1]
MNAVKVERELLSYKTVRESQLYTKKGDKVQCYLCERRCLITPNGFGFCKTRVNIDGRSYTLVYGDVSSISSNPIEKKPFFHYWPGSYALTIGTWSCNFTCPWCQNYDISKSYPDPSKAHFLEPKDLAEMALSEKCKGVSFSFNEPTLLFEYALDVFPLVCKMDMYANYVSNGYMTLEALRALKNSGMDAIKFDVKGSFEAVEKFCSADVNVVWRNINEAKRIGLHVEVVDLVIPRVNDDEHSIRELAKKHIKEAGDGTPLHFTRFYPTYRMSDRPQTSISTLEKAHEIAKKEGVKYVYIGNVSGHRLENTYCHNCGEVLIKRYGLFIVKYAVTHDKRCPKCRQTIPIVGNYVE